MKNKYIAPIIITIVTVCYAIGMAWFLFWAMAAEPLPFLTCVFVLGGPIVGAILIIVALVQRMKEIKGGEEDDAGKY